MSYANFNSRMDYLRIMFFIRGCAGGFTLDLRSVELGRFLLCADFDFALPIFHLLFCCVCTGFFTGKFSDFS